MLNLSCLCGQVRLRLDKRPDVVVECNCTLCSKSGARWGYFHPDQVGIEGETSGYRRQDKDDPAAEIRFCPGCGVTTHYVLTENAVAKHGNVQMGVNMWLADESELAGLELQFPDGRAWAGGGAAFGYVREARVIGE